MTHSDTDTDTFLHPTEFNSFHREHPHQIRLADLSCTIDQRNILRLLNHYAEQPFGMGRSLPNQVQDRLIEGLRKLPNTRVFFAHHLSEPAVGMAICFMGFSSFRALPLINIHDLVVHEDYRGRGLGSLLIDGIAAYAAKQGCCSVTLEVSRDNPARQLYSRKGFRNIQEDDPDGLMLFGKLSLSVASQ